MPGLTLYKTHNSIFIINSINKYYESNAELFFQSAFAICCEGLDINN